MLGNHLVNRCICVDILVVEKLWANMTNRWRGGAGFAVSTHDARGAALRAPSLFATRELQQRLLDKVAETEGGLIKNFTKSLSRQQRNRIYKSDGDPSKCLVHRSHDIP